MVGIHHVYIHLTDKECVVGMFVGAIRPLPTKHLALFNSCARLYDRMYRH